MEGKRDTVGEKRKRGGGVEGCMMRAHNQSRRIDPSRGLRRTCRRISIPSAIWLAHFLPYRHRFTHNKTDKGNSRSVFKRKAATIRVSLGMDNSFIPEGKLSVY